MTSIVPLLQNPELQPLLQKITTLSFSELPADCEERDELLLYYTISVSYRGDDKWAVTYLNDALDADLHDQYEPRPSSRDDDFLNRYRFSLPEAVAIAERAAQQVLFRGVSAGDIEQYGSFEAALEAHRKEGKAYEGQFRRGE